MVPAGLHFPFDPLPSEEPKHLESLLFSRHKLHLLMMVHHFQLYNALCRLACQRNALLNVG